MLHDGGRPVPRIWALLGAHRGDNNQVLALAEAVGLPFEIKTLRYTMLRRLDVRLLGAGLISLDRKSRAIVAGEPPDLIIAIGHRSVPVVRALRKRSGGRARAVQLGNPRIDPAFFDLLITTPQYPVSDAPNVVRIPLALGRSLDGSGAEEASAAILQDLPNPRRLLLLGGPTRYWRLDPDAVSAAAQDLLREARSHGGSVIVLGSPRTPLNVLSAARNAVKDSEISTLFVPVEGPPTYQELLAAADRITVSADSVSMISEALRTGKPVSLIPIQPTFAGQLRMAVMDWLRPGKPLFPRDLRFFWAELKRTGLVGPLQASPTASIPDVVKSSATLVRQLLALPIRRATDAPGSD